MALTVSKALKQEYHDLEATMLTARAVGGGDDHDGNSTVYYSPQKECGCDGFNAADGPELDTHEEHTPCGSGRNTHETQSIHDGNEPASVSNESNHDGNKPAHGNNEPDLDDNKSPEFYYDGSLGLDDPSSIEISPTKVLSMDGIFFCEGFKQNNGR